MSLMRLRNLYTAALLLLSATAIAQPNLIGKYGFRGALGDQVSTAATNVASGVTFSPISRTGVTANVGAGSLNSSNWPQGTAPDPAKYVGFIITPAPGFTVLIDSAVFFHRRSNSGPATLELRTSLDNFATAQGIYSPPPPPAQGAPVAQKEVFGPTLPLTSAIDVRLLGYGATAATGTFRLTDSIMFYGSVVPNGPFILTTPSSLSFGSVAVGSNSTAQTLNVTGGQLTNNVTVTAPAGYEVSDGAGFGSSLTITPNQGSVVTAIQVRFSPTVGGLRNDTLRLEAGSIIAKVPVSGNGSVPNQWSPILPYKSRTAATGVADSLNRIAKVRGVVYGVNVYNPVTAGVQFTLIDPTAGINIRMMGNTTYTVTEGDSVEVEGTVAQFRGLIQINATSITRISGGSNLKAPIVITRMDYPLVSDLVRVNGLRLIAGTWPAAPTGSGFTALATRVANSNDTIAIRVVPQTADVWAMPAPTTDFDLIGLGGQFAPSGSSLGGFQISPRRMSDIIVATTPVATWSPILPYKSRTAATGVADSLNKIAKVRGVVYGVNVYNPATAGVQFTLIDPTAGINVRMMGNTTYTVTEGDSVEVEGTVAQFRGLIQINATGITRISGGSNLKAPIVITRMDYPLVSDLVRVNGLTLVPGTWPATPTGSGFTALATRLANSNDTIAIRVVPQTADVWALPAPTYDFDLIGLGGQFAPSGSSLGGFQISPRRVSDIIQLVSQARNVAANSLRTWPNPTTGIITLDVDASTPANVTVVNSLGQVQRQELMTGRTLDLSTLSNGVYQIMVTQGSASYRTTVVKQ